MANETGGVGSIAIASEVRTVRIREQAALIGEDQPGSGEFDLAGKEIPCGLYHHETIQRLTPIRAVPPTAA